jgi:hypothetical protein
MAASMVLNFDVDERRRQENLWLEPHAQNQLARLALRGVRIKFEWAETVRTATNDVTTIEHVLLTPALLRQDRLLIAESSLHTVLRPQLVPFADLTIERFTSRSPPFLNHFKAKPSTMSSNRVMLVGGAVIAAGGYYLYTAGGDPKAAGKHAQGMLFCSCTDNEMLKDLHSRHP